MNPEILEELMRHYQTLVEKQCWKLDIKPTPVIRSLIASGVQPDWLRDVCHFAVWPLNSQDGKRPEMAFPTDSYV
jgi:hypothetical protein